MKVTIDTGTDELLCSIDRITLNRPEKRNALSAPALRQVLLDLETNNDVGCIVITGAGNAFCAGGDIGGMADNASKGNQPNCYADYAGPSAETLIHKQNAHHALIQPRQTYHCGTTRGCSRGRVLHDQKHAHRS